MFADNRSEAVRPMLKASRQRKVNTGVRAMDLETRETARGMAPAMVRNPGKESGHMTVPALLTRAAARDADKGKA